MHKCENSLLQDALNTIKSGKCHPMVAVIGGSKLEEQAPFIENLLPIADAFIFGGNLANTFLKAKGGRVGISPVEPQMVPFALKILKTAEKHGIKVFLPIDTLAANEINTNAIPSLEGSMALFADKMSGDIGPRTVKLYENAIRMASAIVWNGAMGQYKFAPFASGTDRILHAIAEADAISVGCGSDCEDILKSASLTEKDLLICQQIDW